MQHGLITKIEKKFMVIKTEASDIERIKIRPKVKVGEKIVYTKKDIYHGFNRFSYKQAGASLSVLIMMALVGGFVGALFGRIVFNHKSNVRSNPLFLVTLILGFVISGVFIYWQWFLR